MADLTNLLHAVVLLCLAIEILIAGVLRSRRGKSLSVFGRRRVTAKTIRGISTADRADLLSLLEEEDSLKR